jgi:uncharacterized membrane protein
VLLATLLRLPGLFHDFWLDEIWSLNNVSKMSTPLAVFTLYDENNHILNSLYMYLAAMTPSSDWVKYRLLSFVLGAGTVAAGAALVRRLFTDAFPRVASLVFLAVSFPLVVYSTEARGYGPALFFSILSFYLLLEHKKKPWLSRAFQASLVLGFFAHLEFAYVAVGLFLLYASHLMRAPDSRGEKLIRFAKLFVPPTLIIAFVYVPFVLNISLHSSDPEPSVHPVPVRFFTLMFGRGDYIYGAAASVAALLMLVETCMLVREKNDLGVFMAGLLVLPVAVVLKGAIAGQPMFIAPRYFVLLVPFLFLVLAHALNRFWGRGRWGRTCAFFTLMLIACGSLAADAHFLRVGRGHYLQAMSYMYRSTDSPQVSVSSDHDFRNVTLLLFYDRYMPSDKRLAYVSSSLIPYVTEWFIVHSRGRDPRAPALLKPNNSTVYELVDTYPFNGHLSGFHWSVYRRSEAGR